MTNDELTTIEQQEEQPAEVWTPVRAHEPIAVADLAQRIELCKAAFVVEYRDGPIYLRFDNEARVAAANVERAKTQEVW